jgi:hypothetical protein
MQYNAAHYFIQICTASTFDMLKLLGLSKVTTIEPKFSCNSTEHARHNIYDMAIHIFASTFALRYETLQREQ